MEIVNITIQEQPADVVTIVVQEAGLSVILNNSFTGILVCTQVEYDAIAMPDANTLYFIK